MSESNRPKLPITIRLESPDHAPEDSDWQEECRKFYRSLENALDTGTVEPLRIENTEKGHRGLGQFVEFFHHIYLNIEPVIHTIHVVSLPVVIAHIVMMGNEWVKHRKGAEMIIKFPDSGKELKIPGALVAEKDIQTLSEKDVVKLIEKHLSAKKEGS